MSWVDRTVNEVDLGYSLSNLLRTHGWYLDRSFYRIVLDKDIIGKYTEESLLNFAISRHYHFINATGKHLGFAKAYGFHILLDEYKQYFTDIDIAFSFMRSCMNQLEVLYGSPLWWFYMFDEYSGPYKILEDDSIYWLNHMIVSTDYPVYDLSLDIEHVSSGEVSNHYRYYPDTMQSPIVPFKLRDTSSVVLSNDIFESNCDVTNWRGDSKVRLSGYFDSRAFYIDVQSDNIPVYENPHKVATTPLFFGDFITPFSLDEGIWKGWSGNTALFSGISVNNPIIDTKEETMGVNLIFYIDRTGSMTSDLRSGGGLSNTLKKFLLDIEQKLQVMNKEIQISLVWFGGNRYPYSPDEAYDVAIIKSHSISEVYASMCGYYQTNTGLECGFYSITSTLDRLIEKNYLNRLIYITDDREENPDLFKKTMEMMIYYEIEGFGIYPLNANGIPIDSLFINSTDYKSHEKLLEWENLLIDPEVKKLQISGDKVHKFYFRNWFKQSSDSPDTLPIYFKEYIPYTSMSPVDKWYNSDPSIGNGIQDVIVRKDVFNNYYKSHVFSWNTSTNNIPPIQLEDTFSYNKGLEFEKVGGRPDKKAYAYQFNPTRYGDFMQGSLARIVGPYGVCGWLPNVLFTSPVSVTHGDVISVVNPKICGDEVDFNFRYVTCPYSPLTYPFWIDPYPCIEIPQRKEEDLPALPAPKPSAKTTSPALKVAIRWEGPSRFHFEGYMFLNHDYSKICSYRPNNLAEDDNSIICYSPYGDHSKPEEFHTRPCEFWVGGKEGTVMSLFVMNFSIRYLQRSYKSTLESPVIVDIVQDDYGYQHWLDDRNYNNTDCVLIKQFEISPSLLSGVPRTHSYENTIMWVCDLIWDADGVTVIDVMRPATPEHNYEIKKMLAEGV